MSFDYKLFFFYFKDFGLNIFLPVILRSTTFFGLGNSGRSDSLTRVVVMPRLCSITVLIGAIDWYSMDADTTDVLCSLIF